LLDREARDEILDSDPTHGQLREPLLKVKSSPFMRSAHALGTRQHCSPF
jgi:hypothetical protein